jgi:hypothetical protein
MTYSTKAIFGKRALRQLSAEDYVDWAVEMLVLEQDSFHLRILAGFNRRGSVFEAEDYLLRSIEELNIIEPEQEEAVRTYGCEIAQQIIDGQLTAQEGVKLLYRLCRDMDYSHEFIIWLELDDALDSLLAGEYPYSYPSANLKNFDAIVKKEAEGFIINMQKQTSV